MIIALHGKPKSEEIVQIGHSYILASYDRRGCLHLMREAKGGQNPLHKPKKDETVFLVSDFSEGEATFKSSGSHSGYFSANGQVFWSTIWDDIGPSVYKECSFQEWVDECAQILAGEKKKFLI